MALNIDGWFSKHINYLQLSAQTETYSFRDLCRSSSKALHNQDLFSKAEKEIEAIHKHYQEKLKDHLIKDESIAIEAVAKVLEETNHIGVVIVGIFHLTFKMIYELIMKDNQIEQQVPNIRLFKERARKEFDEIRGLAADLGVQLRAIARKQEIAGWLQAKSTIIANAAHRENYPLRDMYRRALALLKDEKDINKFMSEFNEGLKKHILDKVNEGESGALEVLPQMIEELHHIGIDTVLMFHFTTKNLETLIKEDDHFKAKIPELDRFQRKFMQELEGTLKLASDLGNRLQSVATSG